MLGEPIREKIMNALANSEFDCNSWDDESLYELTDLVLKTIAKELTRGVLED